jgi:hypothetical protein
MVFYFIFLAPNTLFGIGGTGYRSVAYSSSRLIPGFLDNLKTFIVLINQDFGTIWKVIIGIIIICFVSTGICNSAQKKFLSAIVTIAVTAALFVLSYGAYLVINNPNPPPRAFYGVCIFIAIISICSLKNRNTVSIISIIALNWCFLVFAYSYGNALADQMRYVDFRAKVLLNDLNHLFLHEDINSLSVQIENTVEFTPVIDNIARHYPIVKRLIDMDDFTFFPYLTEYHKWGSYDIKNEKSNGDFTTYNLPVILDSYYHTIHSDGRQVLILLKH